MPSLLTFWKNPGKWSRLDPGVDYLNDDPHCRHQRREQHGHPQEPLEPPAGPGHVLNAVDAGLGAEGQQGGLQATPRHGYDRTTKLGGGFCKV